MKSLVVYVFLGLCLFLLSGGLTFLYAMNGGAMDRYTAYTVLTSPFAFVLFVMGLFGVRLMVKSRKLALVGDRWCLLVLVGGFLLVFMVSFLLDQVAVPRG